MLRYFLTLTFLLIAATALAQQEHGHGKCLTGPVRHDPKAPRALDPLPTEFRDSRLSPSGLFLIHFDATGNADSVTKPEYVQRALLIADSAYDFEIRQLGFTPPAFTSGSHYDLYLTPFHLDVADNRPYGATIWLDGGGLPSAPSGTERTRTFCEIENSFADSHYATHGYDALRITIFHEFFHMVQFSGYGVPPTGNPDYRFFQEMSSVWMEWLSSPTVKDYMQYVGSYMRALDLRFDLIPDLGMYGQYLYFAYLSDRFDTSIVRQIWEHYRDSSSDPVACIDKVLNEHGSSFCNEYKLFGSDVIQTGRRFSGASHLPDAQRLPVDTIRAHIMGASGPAWQFQTVALSLNFAIVGESAIDTAIYVFARNTDRMFLSYDTLQPPLVMLDSPAAFCDTVLNPATIAAELEVYPNPLVMRANEEDFAQFVASTKRPVSTILDIYSMAGTNIRHSEANAEPLRSTWNASWDGRDDMGKPVTSGEYIYKLKVDGALKIGKIVVVRK